MNSGADGGVADHARSPATTPPAAHAPDSPCSSLRCALAPLLDIHRPSVAGPRVARLSPTWFAFSLALGVLSVCAAIGGVVLSIELLPQNGRASNAGSTPDSVTPPVERVEKTQSLAELWADWHRDGAIGWFEWTLLGVACGAVGAVAVTAFLFLSVVHERGSLWASYRRAVQAASAGLGLSAAWICVVGAAAWWIQWARGSDADDLAPLLLVGIQVCIVILLAWQRRAAAASRIDASSDALPLWCESCGYDLTHVPESGTCAECGAGVAASLENGRRRRPCAWQARGGLIDWALTSLDVVGRSGRFYRRLTVRSGDRRAERFAVWHFVAIGVGAAIWLVWLVPEVLWQVLPVLAVLSGAAVLAGWLVWRGVAAVVTTWWLWHDATMSGTAARVVVGYESAFLWVFCAMNGAFSTLIVTHDASFRQSLVGQALRSVLGIPPGPAGILLINAMLIGGWFLRYRRIRQSIRWANF